MSGVLQRQSQLISLVFIEYRDDRGFALNASYVPTHVIFTKYKKQIYYYPYFRNEELCEFKILSYKMMEVDIILQLILLATIL